jgi:hypothetical protein
MCEEVVRCEEAEQKMHKTVPGAALASCEKNGEKKSVCFFLANHALVAPKQNWQKKTTYNMKKKFDSARKHEQEHTNTVFGASFKAQSAGARSKVVKSLGLLICPE